MANWKFRHILTRNVLEFKTRELVSETLPDCCLVMALSYTGIPSPMLLKAFSVIT